MNRSSDSGPVRRRPSRNSGSRGTTTRGADNRKPRLPPPPVPAPGARDRRPLSHTGGEVVRLRGPEVLQQAIRRSLSVDPEQGVRDHVHGFHSYPARLHPGTAATLIEDLSAPGGRVADPFCGSGTVLVEARLRGRLAGGVDLNPLAVRLTRFKSEPLPARQRQQVLEAAERVCAAAEERRVAKAGPTRKYPPSWQADFEIHTLLELDGLADGIKKEREKEPVIGQALLLALSSTFSKVARQTGSEGRPGKRLPSGFAIGFYEARVGEMLRQLEEYEQLLPRSAPRVYCREGDARELKQLGLRGVELFVTSPPYPGVLDYAQYHRTRLAWLGLKAGRFEHEELGARRQLQRLEHSAAAERWEKEFVAVLSQMRSVLVDNGLICLVLADSMLCGEAYPADTMTARCAERSGLRVVAQGAQRRPHFHRTSEQAFGNRPRFEHLILLSHGDAR